MFKEVLADCINLFVVWLENEEEKLFAKLDIIEKKKKKFIFLITPKFEEKL